MTCSLIPQFSSEDVVAVRVKSVRREGDNFIFVSAYMAMEEPAPPEILKELLSFSDRGNIPTVIGTDTNAHHTVWGSSNVNSRGIDLLTYCASSNLYFCNVGNKPTFRTRKREEVLDLTLMNRNAVNCIRDWHASDVPSFSDHMYIRIRIQMSTKKAKMIMLSHSKQHQKNKTDMTCSLIPQFSSEDVVAVRVKNVKREGDSFVVESAYMALEEPAPPVILKEPLPFRDKGEIPTVIGTNANAHHTVWSSSNINTRGMNLLMFCASANLHICNVGKKPTFRTRKKKVLDLSLINRNAENCISDWHVSDGPSFSDHMYIRFRVQSGTKRVKMIKNVRRTCWNKYANELDHRLHDLNITG